MNGFVMCQVPPKITLITPNPSLSYFHKIDVIFSLVLKKRKQELKAGEWQGCDEILLDSRTFFPMLLC